MYRIMVCDDEEFYRDKINSYIMNYGKRTGNAFDILLHNDGSYAANSMEEYDLYFLDVEMDNINGVEAAKSILSKFPMACIIFFTSHRNYTDVAFQLRISRYIDKPFDEARLCEVMDSIMPIVKRSKDTVNLKKENGDKEDVRIDNIICIKTENKAVIVITRFGNMRYMGKYEETSNLIENYDFLEIRKKCMVNMQYAVNFSDTTALLRCDNEEFRENISSRTDKNEIKKRWLDYRRRFA